MRSHSVLYVDICIIVLLLFKVVNIALLIFVLTVLVILFQY